MSERVWRCGRFALPLTRTLVMGIVNVTPDSFSDGGRFVGGDETVDHAAAVAAARRMIDEGADILDIGGESTRPGSDEVDPAVEAARVIPVIEALADADVPLSVDTRHAAVADAAVAAGAAIINDVAGFRDPAMVAVAASTDAGLVAMHMLGEPKTMQEQPRYDDVVAEVAAWLAARASELQAAGVEADRIAVDPGIGFGKTVEHNLALLRALHELACAGRPVLVGASRKRFIGAVLGDEDPADRLDGSLAVAAWAADHGAAILRVHDVAPTVRVVRMVEAIAGANRPAV